MSAATSLGPLSHHSMEMNPRELVKSAFQQHSSKGAQKLTKIHIETLMQILVKPGLSDIEEAQLRRVLDSASDPHSGTVDCELLVDWIYNAPFAGKHQKSSGRRSTDAGSLSTPDLNVAPMQGEAPPSLPPLASARGHPKSQRGDDAPEGGLPAKASQEDGNSETCDLPGSSFFPPLGIARKAGHEAAGLPSVEGAVDQTESKRPMELPRLNLPPVAGQVRTDAHEDRADPCQAANDPDASSIALTSAHKEDGGSPSKAVEGEATKTDKEVNRSVESPSLNVSGQAVAGDNTTFIYPPPPSPPPPPGPPPQLPSLAGASVAGRSEVSCSLSTLHAACKAGNHNLVRFLLDVGADIDTQLKDGVTPLHITCQRGDLEMLTFLLERRADVNIQMSNGFCALVLAVRCSQFGTISNDDVHEVSPDERQLKAVRTLLQAGAKTNLCTAAGWTALLYACKKGSVDMATELLKAQANPSLATHAGRTPLEVASSEAQHALVKLLLLRGASVNAAAAGNGCTALHAASQLQRQEVARTLLDFQADVNAETDSGQRSLHLAVNVGSLVVVKCLLDARADANAKDSSGLAALHMSVEHSQNAIARALIAARADVELRGPHDARALHLACQFGHEGMVGMLLDSKASADCALDGDTRCLHVAVHGGHCGIVEKLLQHDVTKFSVNMACTAKGWFPLFLASRKGHESIVQRLLKEQAEVDQTTRGKLTALHIAAQRGYMAVATMLLDAGADPSGVGHASTPQSMAQHKGHQQLARVIAKYVEMRTNLKAMRPTHLTPTSTWQTAGLREWQRRSGKMYYEMFLKAELTDPQVGWVSENFADVPYQADDGEASMLLDGVGDDIEGWATDGVRMKFWHIGDRVEHHWERPWKANDVIGLAVDISGGKMEFSLNGTWMQALQRPFDFQGKAIFPAVSTIGDYVLNVPKQAWKHKPPSSEYEAWADNGVFTRPRKLEESF